ncbi:MAG: TonB-dependent receptor [Bacteroidales bacterium]|nr:TonB-dependent receptor [Bacteroidales bacterium]
MKFIILSFYIILFSIAGFSQNKIAGKITDSKTGESIEGVNIFVLTNQTGTISNKDGKYKLDKLPSKGTVKLQFSFIGYKTVLKSIFLTGQSQSLDIQMIPTVLKAEEVVVSGGAYSTQHENAIAIESISPKQIETSSSPSMMEALASRPGLDMIAKSPGVAKPVIRGLSMTNILVLNNGVKLENYQFSEDHPFIIDEYGIDKVEFIKGPASILYGSDAVGGIINFVKEKPATFNSIASDFHQQFHSNTTGWVTNLGIKGNRNNILWGIRAGIKSHKDFTDNSTVVPNSRFNETETKASAGIIRSFGSFKLFYDYNHDRFGMTVPPALTIANTKERINNFWYQNLYNHLLSSRNKLFFGKQQIDINAAYQNNHRQLITSPQMPADTMVDMVLQTLSYETKTTFPGKNNSSLTIGIQGDFRKNTNGNAPSHIIPDATISDLGFVGLWHNKILPKLNTQAGLRYDIRQINIPAQSYSNINAYDSSIVFPMKNQYRNFSFSGGITYSINDLWLVRFNVASAFRSPNLAELTQNGIHSIRYEIGNPAMTPQRNYETDLGLHYHGTHFSAEVSPFYNRINNYIYLSPTNDSTTDGYHIYRYQQTNSVIYGGEVSTNYATNNLQIGLTYSYLVGIQDDGNYLPFIPQNKLQLNVKYQIKKLGFLQKPFIGANLLLADKQNNPSIFETKTNSYYLIGLSAGGTIKIKKQPVEYRIGVCNLLNAAYYDHLSTLKDVGFYNMGRNISITVSVPF